MSPARVMLFTGAPPTSSLDPTWATLQHFEQPFRELLDIRQGHSSINPASEPSHAAWRSLLLTRQPLHTGLGQVHALDHGSFRGNADFFTTADVSFDDGVTGTVEDGDEDGGTLLTDFCEQSLAAHNSLPSSQLDSLAQSTSVETSFMTTTTSSTTATAPNATTMAPPPIPLHLSDLEDVPSARRINALNPQTVTLNLIVAVLSVAQPRTVTTRWGNTVALIEVLVGDETVSGFAVTFWLPADKAAESEVGRLRRQDVVLMQNVALHVFRGKVYGQSLSRGMTKVSLLWKRDGSGYYSTRDLAKKAPKHPQQEKTGRVKDWVLRFVGGDPMMRTRRTRKSWDRPPDDTQ